LILYAGSIGRTILFVNEIIGPQEEYESIPSALRLPGGSKEVLKIGMISPE